MSGIIIKYGLISGLISVLSALISYSFGTELIKNWVLNSIISLIVFGIIIFLAIKAVKEYRKMKEGIIDFKDAFITSAGTLLIMTLITVIFSVLLYNVIDKDYAEKTKLAVMENMEERVDKSGLEENQKIEYMESMENRDFNFKSGKTLAIYFGVSLVISLIIALSIKKDINESFDTV